MTRRTKTISTAVWLWVHLRERPIGRRINHGEDWQGCLSRLGLELENEEV